MRILLHPSERHPCIPMPDLLQTRVLAALQHAGTLRHRVSTARLLSPCAARYIAEPVKIISACSCVV